MYGTIASFTLIDEATHPTPIIEVTVRADNIQRGDPKIGMVRVQVDDMLQASGWRPEETKLGAQGLWFLHRVVTPAGSEPTGHLVRYISAIEVARDPKFAETLMGYVIEGSIDQAIRPDVLMLLQPRPEAATQTVGLELEYAPDGQLAGAAFAERSGNPLFDDHVMQTAVVMHRYLRMAAGIRGAEVRVTRQVNVDLPKGKSR